MNRNILIISQNGVINFTVLLLFCVILILIPFIIEAGNRYFFSQKVQAISDTTVQTASYSYGQYLYTDLKSCVIDETIKAIDEIESDNILLQNCVDHDLMSCLENKDLVNCPIDIYTCFDEHESTNPLNYCAEDRELIKNRENQALNKAYEQASLVASDQEAQLLSLDLIEKDAKLIFTSIIEKDYQSFFSKIYQDQESVQVESSAQLAIQEE